VGNHQQKRDMASEKKQKIEKRCLGPRVGQEMSVITAKRGSEGSGREATERSGVRKKTHKKKKGLERGGENSRRHWGFREKREAEKLGGKTT